MLYHTVSAESDVYCNINSTTTTHIPITCCGSQLLQYVVTTSNKEVMFYSAFVCLSVCMSACLLATSRKTTVLIGLQKILPDISLDKEVSIEFSKLPSSASASRNLKKGLFNIAR